MIPPPPGSTLFPYTTLFRSSLVVNNVQGGFHNSLPSPTVQLGDHGKESTVSTPLLFENIDVPDPTADARSEEHTSELQSRRDLVCRLLLEKKNHRFVARAPV